MADKELGAMRRRLVAQMSRELISQLLDDLLEDGVLNDGEKDAVLEENKSTADRAHCLVDTVIKKGDEASRKMISHLQHRDPTLYSSLC
uniref:CARD domain-containing protein n=1 Tax=Monopterus albus TaxID=43700 RepID=A0A3Q3Q1I1_MONAL